jgi:AcrR family transcriptional regulator
MKADNRSAILDHALAMFAARGYDAVGVQEVAAAAGVTKPTLYHYFRSKRGLLDALLAAHFTRLVAVVTPAAAYAGDLPLTLTRVTRAFFDFAAANPAFYRMQLAMRFAPLESDPAQAVQVYNAQIHEALVRLFTLATADHGNMQGRHDRYAVTLRGMIDTYIGLHLADRVTLDDVLAHQAVHQYMHGIYS